MSLRVQTQVSGNVFILHCEGRIVFGDEGAALRRLSLLTWMMTTVRMALLLEVIRLTSGADWLVPISANPISS